MLLLMDGVDELPCDVEEIRRDDRLAVSLVVRFTLLEHVTNTNGLELEAIGSTTRHRVRPGRQNGR